MKLAAAASQSSAPATGDGAGALRARVGALVRDVRRGYLQLFGIADYERYLAHHRARHPDTEPLSRQHFHARAIDRKYCRSGPRCC
jgi:uncharacterized short protein YbdD (DUF466 family)